MYFFDEQDFVAQLNFYRFCYFQQLLALNTSQSSQMKVQTQGQNSEKCNKEIERILEPNQSQILDQACFEYNKSMQAKTKKRDQDQNFSIRKQKLGRNIHSNTLRYFLKYLENLRKYPERILQIAEKLGVQSIEINFFDKVSEYVVLARHYAKPGTFKDICLAKTCPQQFSRPFRILLRSFLKQQISLFLLRTNKLKRKAKMVQIDSARKLLKILFDQ